jgi:hypothetical protein
MSEGPSGGGFEKRHAPASIDVFIGVLGGIGP